MFFQGRQYNDNNLTPIELPNHVTLNVHGWVTGKTRSMIGGGRGCDQFAPVLGGNGTKIAPTGDLINPLVKCDEFGASLPTMYGIM